MLGTTDKEQDDILCVMLQQEETVYFSHSECQCNREVQLLPIEKECRINMVDWCYRMIDYCNLNRETVSIAMNYVDRFLRTKISSEKQYQAYDHASYQLVAMTALFVAIKVHETRAIDIRTLSLIAKGVYSIKQIANVELQIMNALEWRLHPPTAMSCVRLYITSIPKYSEWSDDKIEPILALTSIQTENAVFDHELSAVRASVLGYCALDNALGILCSDYQHFPVKQLALEQRRPKFVVHIETSDEEIKCIQIQLLKLIHNHPKLHHDKCIRGALIKEDKSVLKTVATTDDDIMQPKKDSPRSTICSYV